MLNLFRSLSTTLALFALLFVELPAYVQAQSSNSTVTTTVTVLGPKFSTPPPITKEDVIVRAGNSRLNVVKWISAQKDKAGLQLAIVIDDAASQATVAPQLRDLAAFINTQPANAAVGVFYASHGTVQSASPFSTDHQAVAKTLRLPLGLTGGDSPSVYLSLSEFINRHWPPTQDRREVLLIASGVDRLDQGPQSPYVDKAIEDIQKAGVVVHTIYAGAGVRFGESLRGQFAQGNLEKITSASGGYGFFQGTTAPVSFSPYLKQLDAVLRNQYHLTFTAPNTKEKGELHEIDIRVEQPNVELKYPKQVFFGQAK